MHRGIQMPPPSPPIAPSVQTLMAFTYLQITPLSSPVLTMGKSSSGSTEVPIPQQPFSLISRLLSVCSWQASNAIFADNGDINNRVDQWSFDGMRAASPMSVCSRCAGLFVDINNDLYCSQDQGHQVVSQSLDNPTSRLTIVAGIGCAGNSSSMLHNPNGIFVTINLDLYVADWGNDRIQLFRSGEVNGTTVAGNGSAVAVPLNRPTGIVVGADGYLFIVDWGNHRIIGLGSDGFRCLVGCFGTSGSAANQLYHPHTLSFDSDGNMFVTDEDNHRIQKYLLANDSCGK